MVADLIAHRDEYAFSDTRTALTRTVLAWLSESCLPHLSEE